MPSKQLPVKSTYACVRRLQPRAQPRNQQPLFSPTPAATPRKPTNFPRSHALTSPLQIRPGTTIHQPHTVHDHHTTPFDQNRRSPPPIPRHGVPAQQQRHRHPQHHHLPPLHPHPRRRHLAGHARRRHRVRALPLRPGHRARRLPHGGLHRGARRGMLPRELAPLGLPPRHVRPHRRALLLHRLRVRRHQQGGRGGRVRERLQGVQARGLLQLAAEEGGEQQELEQDQELPPGLQGLQEPAGREPDVPAVHLLRPIPHPVWLLQAPHQLRLHLRPRHGVDQGHNQLDGPGLQDLEQRRQGALLRLPVVQGRCSGHLEAGLEACRRRLYRLPRLHRHRLLHWLLRVQEQPQGQRLPWRVEERARIRMIDDCFEDQASARLVLSS